LGEGVLPPWAMAVDDVPHEWLFPRMAAVVHHGGAGTTGAGLRAGVPSVLTPLGFDQPFWGARVAALGVGPPPVSRRALTAERLAAAIETAVTDASMRERAARLGERIRAEDGAARAVEVLDRHLRELGSVAA
jgi:UDP:flavonoid glycosyltransferase YjiC (YdhE family)